MFFSSSWSWKIIYYLLCILMNDNYRTRTVCLTFTAQCCCKICPLTADSPLPGSACVLQYFHFAELHTSARLHLKGKYCPFYSALFIRQLQLPVSFQISHHFCPVKIKYHRMCWMFVMKSGKCIVRKAEHILFGTFLNMVVLVLVVLPQKSQDFFPHCC